MMTRLHAIACAGYARDAYDLTPVVGARSYLATGPWTCPHCGGVTKLDVYARLHHEHETAILAFRGTDAPADWWANLDTRRCPMIAGAAHAGFRHGWLAIREQVQADLARLIRYQGVTRLVCTGHSKGGGEAVLAAYDLARSNIGLGVEVVTFGAPRACDRHLAPAIAAWLQSCTHYVNGPDPVAAVPPLCAGWRQPGRTVRLRPLVACLAPLSYLRGELLFQSYHPITAYLKALPHA